MKDWLAVLGFLLVLALVAVSAVLWFRGPCWIYKFEAANKIPGRCIMVDQ